MMRLPHFSSRCQRCLARWSGCSPRSRSSGPPRFLVSEVEWSDRGERCIQSGFCPRCCCCWSCCCWPKWYYKWQEGRYCWCDSLCATFGWCSFPWPPGASKARPRARPWGKYTDHIETAKMHQGPLLSSNRKISEESFILSQNCASHFPQAAP